MRTSLVNHAAGVIHRALQRCETSTGIAIALDSAQMLQDPQTAAELERQVREQVAVAIEERGRAFLPKHPVYPYVDVFAGLARGQDVAPQQAAEVTVYRAQHDSIVMGLYTTAAAARAHCETEIRREYPDSLLDWIVDEDAVAELVAETADGETETGYVVEPLTVASHYNEGADE